jgi:hypothetical protein
MTFFVEGVSKHLDASQQVRRIGEFREVGEAVTAAKRAIDAFLEREFSPGMSAKELFARYQATGEYPFIFRDDDKTFNVPGFSHVGYALTRSEEICGGRR